uniref:Reverse transcriptase domain-containing protein n=1 Tax=Tanacetum cinerariifolium TaxID=118510 RepID=A0A6L2K3E2_TANCI|nr:reverse transcriptase domain-containing protein [Tanacetum cinerariifolium]
MRTRSSSNLSVVSSNPSISNPKCRNYKRSKQPFILEESPIDTMADQRTIAELLRAPTEGYAEAIVVPLDLWAARRWLEKEPSRSIHTWEDIISKFINEFFPPSRTTNLRNEISNFQQRFDESFHEAWDRYKDLLPDQDSLNAAAGGNLLERHTQDVLIIIKNKSKVCNSQNKSVVSQVKSCDANSNSSSEIAKLTHVVNQQTSAMTTAMTAIFKQFQGTPPPASVKTVEKTCVTCGGAHPYYQCHVAGGNIFPKLRDKIYGYVSTTTVNYNQGNSVYRPPGMANQIRPPGFPQSNVQNNQNRFGQPQGFNHGNNLNPKESYQAPTQQNQNVPFNELEKVKRMNEANMKAMKTQINMVKNELRNEMKNSIQGELKAITTLSGIVLDRPTVPTPPPFINLKDERVEETLTDPNLSEYTIKKMLKALLSNKEKLQELANTPLNENCSAVILKKLPKKLGDPRKFLILCGFSELKCKAPADLGARINLMPLSVWKKLGLPELISTRMTLELANRAICTPTGIARDVFVPVGEFTFPANFVIVDYESDPRVPLILGRPFLQTARALIDVHGEEMIFYDDDKRLTLNMRHDTSSYSNQPQKESINLINVFNNSKGGNVLPEKLLYLDSTKDLHPPLHDNQLSGSTTYSSSPNPLLEEFADELALITFPPKYDDDLYNLADNFVDSMPEMFTDEHTLDYSSLLIFDEYDDDFLKVESDAENVYDDPFDSKGEKIKESKLLIDELDLPCDLLPFEYDSFIS